MPKEQVKAATPSLMHSCYRQAGLVLAEPPIASVPRVYVKNIEAGVLASRNPYERGRITPPQVCYGFSVGGRLFVPARGCRRFVSMARKARQSLVHECGQSSNKGWHRSHGTDPADLSLPLPD